MWQASTHATLSISKTLLVQAVAYVDLDIGLRTTYCFANRTWKRAVLAWLNITRTRNSVLNTMETVDRGAMEATRRYPRTELHATLHFGASSRPNPGYGSIAFVIFNDHDGTALENFNACLNVCLKVSSEIASYKALIAGLRHARRLRIRHITVVGQCRLVKEYEQGARTWHSCWFERIYYRFQKLSAEFENINLRDVHYNDNTALHSLIRRGFSNTFVDRSIRARDEILLKYRDPRSARKYVLEESCEGYYKTKFILDTIQNNLPESYAAIKSMCEVINRGSGEWCDLRSNRVMASFLAIF